MKGFFNKFHVIRKETGMPVAYPTFTLRLDGQDPHALKALEAYAISVKEENQNLHDDLMLIITLASTKENTITRDNIINSIRS